MSIKIKLLKTKLTRMVFFDYLSPSPVHNDLRHLVRFLFPYCTRHSVEKIDLEKFTKFSLKHLHWNQQKSLKIWGFLILITEA